MIPQRGLRGRRERATVAKLEQLPASTGVLTAVKPSRYLGSPLIALLLLACPTVASADERFEREVGAVTAEIAADNGLFLFVGSETEGMGPGLFDGYGPGASSLGFTAGEGALIDDLHIGTDRDLRPVGVFTYCDGRTCDLYTLRFDTREIRRLALSRKGCDERAGRMLRGVLYFEQFSRSPQRAVNRCPGGVYEKRRGRRARRVLKEVPESWDVSAGRLAFERERITREGAGDGDTADVGFREVRVKRIGKRRSRRLAFGDFQQNRKSEFFGGTSFSDVTPRPGLRVLAAPRGSYD